MQLILIIAFIVLFQGGAYAQTFPSGSENVEINLDALKPMDQDYDPPTMFDAPLTNMKESTDILTNPGKSPNNKQNTKSKEVEYFNPPPVPPKRPQTFQASPEYIRLLSDQNRKIKVPDSKTSALTETPKNYNNDINADVMQMDAQSILDSIEGNDLTEYSAYVQNDNEPTKNKTVQNPHPALKALYTLEYDLGKVELPSEGEAYLTSNIVPALKYNPDIRLEIQTYASPNIDEKNPRRTSLMRALNIRRFLEKHGIAKDRVSIRALGDKTAEPPLDRADFKFLPL